MAWIKQKTPLPPAGGGVLEKVSKINAWPTVVHDEPS